MNRTLAIATMMLVLASTSCANDDPADPQAAGASAESSTPPSSTPASSSPEPLSSPGETVTDFNGPPDIGISFSVPQGVEEVPDVGKRAYELTNGEGMLMIGELKHLYGFDKDGLLVPRRVGDDVGAALDVIRQRDEYDIVAQGTVPVADMDAQLVVVQLDEGRQPADLWCYTHDTSCYKIPEGLSSQAILVPWRKSMLWIAAEWESKGSPPAALLKARDELLQSLKLG